MINRQFFKRLPIKYPEDQKRSPPSSSSLLPPLPLSPLYPPSKRQDTRFIEYLADRGCDLSLASTDTVGMTPIHWACTESSIAVINLLLNRNVSINLQDSSGCTPLLVAAQYGHATLVGYLIKRGASVSILDGNKDSALHWAAYKGDVAIVGLLHHLGLDVDARDGYGQTPLHLSALRGNAEVVDYLVGDGGSGWMRW